MTYIKAYRKANTSHWSCKWRQDLHAFLNTPSEKVSTPRHAFACLPLKDYHLRTLLQHWSPFDINIEEVDFLVSLCNISLLIDPYKGILHFSTLCRLMDSNIDVKVCLLSLLLKT